jgi:tetratricopeptide (TPR) repeat protein
MPSGPGEHYDFFLSRRGSVADVAREVTDVLTEKYKVFVQDYDIPITANFIEKMHEALKNARDLVILFTRDYEQSPYTRMEFTSFEANAAQSTEKRRMVILRCEDAPLLGLFAPHVYQDLVGITDAKERSRRILDAAEGRSQAFEPPPRPFIGVPPRIASFTGRADELDRLDDILMRDQPAAAEEANVEKAAKAALRQLAEQRATWLLVYDNVPAPDALADLLPSTGARLLITSRFSDWSELAYEVPLDVLPLQEAAAFLQNRTGRSDAAGANALAHALGNLPLALDHAAAYCKRTQTSFAHYAEKASNLIGAAPRGTGYPRSVAATFDLAITEAVAQCPAAEALMAYLAHCAPDRIPMTLIEGAVEDEAERLQALAALVEVSLVQHHPFEDNTPAVTAHRLVQAVARAREAKGFAQGFLGRLVTRLVRRIQPKANGSAQNAIDRLIARLKAIYPTEGYSDPQLWPPCAKLTPHLLALRDGCPNAASDIVVWSKLLNDAGSYFHGRGAYSQAAPLLRDALTMREKVLGPEHPATATSLNNLAGLLHDQGDLAGARPLLERAVAIREKALGSGDVDYRATFLANLAALLHDEGDLAGARPLYERVLAIREKALGPEHPDTATSLDNLGLLLKDQDDFAGARPLYDRALAIREKALGPEHPLTARSLNNLADLLHAQGDLAAARRLDERALAIREKALGPEHPATADSLENLALLLGDQGDIAGARPLLERAVAIREKAFGPEHHKTGFARSHLSLALLIGSPTKALTLGEVDLTAYDKVLGRDHPRTKFSARVTADALDAPGRTDEAKALREKYGITEAEKPKDS